MWNVFHHKGKWVEREQYQLTWSLGSSNALLGPARSLVGGQTVSQRLVSQSSGRRELFYNLGRSLAMSPMLVSRARSRTKSDFVCEREVRRKYWQVAGTLRKGPDSVDFFKVESVGKRRRWGIITPGGREERVSLPVYSSREHAGAAVLNSTSTWHAARVRCEARWCRV
jgi:hypothetical protein